MKACHQFTMISVIIPTFQEEGYIERTLASIAVFKPEVEIIIVDGDSKDKTVSIASQYADKIQIVSGRGIAKAKNRGATQAKGDILVFLDSDVIVPPEFLQRIKATFRNQTIIAASCQIMPLHYNVLEFIYFLFLNLLIRFSVQALPKTKFKLGFRGEFIAVRKNEFLKVGGFNETIACLEDVDITFRLFEFRKFGYIENMVVYESLRRIRKRGLFNILKLWATEYIVYLVHGLPKSRVWEVAR